MQVQDAASGAAQSVSDAATSAKDAVMVSIVLLDNGMKGVIRILILFLIICNGSQTLSLGRGKAFPCQTNICAGQQVSMWIAWKLGTQ